jgi:hypothetical protein
MKQIMKSTKRLLLFLSCCATLACGADLAGVRTVYVLPMAHGLDQYLANRVTNEHVFQVVTDPKLADAVLTEHIGAPLQQKLDELLAVPEKPEAKTDEKNAAKDADISPLATKNKLDTPGANSTIGRSKGTVFLVDTKSRQVVWSVFELAKDSSSKELDRTASDIVSRLKKEISPGKK